MIALELTDAAFLEAVTDTSLPVEQFDHRAHLRLAWACLRADGLEAGSARVAALIRNYADAKGATTKFDAELTREWMTRVWAAMEQAAGDDFTAFLDARPRLLRPTPSG